MGAGIVVAMETEHKLALLSDAAPALELLHGAEERRHYGRDWTRHWEPDPMAVALPRSTSEVEAIVRWARTTATPLVPSGGRTGLSGGAVASRGELVVSTEKLNAVVDFNAADRQLRIQAGVTTARLQQLAADKGLYYPVDFASAGSSHIGGNVATNAGGIRVLRYGNTRNWVAGLQVVTGTGERLELNRGLAKNATGYDLRHLIIGSEGTLGMVTEVTVQLCAPPPPSHVVLLACRDSAAAVEIFGLAGRALALQAFEFFSDAAMAHVLARSGRAAPLERAPCYALLECDEDESGVLALYETATAQGLVSDAVVAESGEQAAMLWALRERISESIAERQPYKTDISVRPSQVPQALAGLDQLVESAAEGVEVVWFGHLGDGNIHFNILPPENVHAKAFAQQSEALGLAVFELVHRLGGSISAEHGVGLLKKPHLHFARSDQEIELFRSLKRAFDPDLIMNPGKIFDA